MAALVLEVISENGEDSCMLVSNGMLTLLTSSHGRWELAQPNCWIGLLSF